MTDAQLNLLLTVARVVGIEAFNSGRHAAGDEIDRCIQRVEAERIAAMPEPVGRLTPLGISERPEEGKAP